MLFETEKKLKNGSVRLKGIATSCLLALTELILVFSLTSDVFGQATVYSTANVASWKVAMADLTPPPEEPENSTAPDSALDSTASFAPTENRNVTGTDPVQQGLFKNVDFNGYINAGFLMNTRGAHWNGNVFCGSENGGALNAIYLQASKTAETCKVGGDWGFGVDFTYGSDSRFLRTVDGFDQDWWTGKDGRGNPWYGFAMPQLYAEWAVRHFTFRAGHFYTLLGYESSLANGRFFYSSGIAFDSLPATHTGGMLLYDGIKDLDIKVGWVNGNNQGFSDEYGGSMLTGQFKYTLNEDWSASYSFLAGDMSDYQLNDTTRYKSYGSLHSWVLSAKVNPCLDMATTADLLDYNGDDAVTVTTFGEHICRRLNEKWRLGVRAEWQRFEYETDAIELVSLTFGANWAPTGDEKNLLVRPEIRYDSNDAQPYGKGSDQKDQLCLGMDFMHQF